MKNNSSRRKFQKPQIQSRHHHGGVHHPHWCLSDDAWVVHCKPTGPYLVDRWLSLSLLILNTMVSWRSTWCNSFCGVFVGIRWTLSLWSDLFYPWKLFEFWSLICMIFIASYFFSKTLVWFGQQDWFFLQWEEVLCSGFDLAVFFPSDRRCSKTHMYHCY